MDEIFENTINDFIKSLMQYKTFIDEERIFSAEEKSFFLNLYQVLSGLTMTEKGHHGMGLHVRPHVGSGAAAAGTSGQLDNDAFRSNVNDYVSALGLDDIFTNTDIEIQYRESNTQGRTPEAIERKLALDFVDNVLNGGLKKLADGEPISEKHIAELIGAPDGSKVVIHFDSQYLNGTSQIKDKVVFQDDAPFKPLSEFSSRETFMTQGQTIKKEPDFPPVLIECSSQFVKKHEIAIYIDPDTKQPYSRLEYLIVDNKAPSGLGTSIALKQLDSQKRAGLTHQELEAAGDYGDVMESELRGGYKKPWIGFYVWPLLGYDGNVTGKCKERLIERRGDKYTDIQTVRDVLSQVKGREDWLGLGSAFYASFDLSDSSQSVKDAAGYMVERIKRASSSPVETKYSSSEFTTSIFQSLFSEKQNQTNEKVLYNKVSKLKYPFAPFDLNSEEERAAISYWDKVANSKK